MSERRAGDCWEVSSTRARNLIDSDGVQLRRLLQLPYAARVAIAAELVSRVGPSSCVQTSALALGGETGDVMREALAAMSDGQLDRDEAKRLASELADVSRVVAQMQAACAAAMEGE